MSLYIYLTNEQTGEEVLSLNWLRNPFGLERWAEANVQYVQRGMLGTPMTLWEVCNTWNYDKSEQVDRPLFLQVVNAYSEVIKELVQGYFFFTDKDYHHFVHPHEEMLSRVHYGYNLTFIDGSVKLEGRVGIPMEQFGHPCFHLNDLVFPNHHTLSHYQDWFAQLVEFAEFLQDPRNRFECSN